MAEGAGNVTTKSTKAGRDIQAWLSEQTMGITTYTYCMRQKQKSIRIGKFYLHE